MKHFDSSERIRSWIVDYSAARAKAIEWLGDRYLLAKPINRGSAVRHASAVRQYVMPVAVHDGPPQPIGSRSHTDAGVTRVAATPRPLPVNFSG
jgi:hypothetical protein